MKNKSKLNKIKQNKSGVKLPDGWFLMLKNETSVSDIAALLDGYNTQVWTEFEVIEVEIEEKASIDIEPIECDLGDDFSNDFVSSNGIVKIFYITFKQEIYEAAKTVMKKISAGIDGFICGDTEDFMPRF